MDDASWMRQALALAERGRGHVEPNPLVGAVVVRDDQLVGSGCHERFGSAHAEINALQEAGASARDATLFVTLEPCCHQGKTPPCTEAVLRAGVKRVVAAHLDPFPEVAGKGVERLRQAGVEVAVGVCEQEALRLNAPYIKLLKTGRPYVHAKWAMTLDGKIASRAGDSRWISNEASRRRVHALRGRLDAVIIGIGTAQADDPELTARPPGPRTAVRVVLDRQGKLSPRSKLVRTARSTPVLVVSGDENDQVVALRVLGCECLVLPDPDGVPSIDLLLEELGRRRCTNVLVEGGSTVFGAFLDADAIDEVHVFVAPCLVGGSAAPSPTGGLGAETIARGLRLDDVRVEALAGDVYVNGLVRPRA